MSLDKITSKCLRIHDHTPEQGCDEEKPITLRVQEVKDAESKERWDAILASAPDNAEADDSDDYCPCCGCYLWD